MVGNFFILKSIFFIKNARQGEKTRIIGTRDENLVWPSQSGESARRLGDLSGCCVLGHYNVGPSIVITSRGLKWHKDKAITHKGLTA